jgi:hypothetical protein
MRKTRKKTYESYTLNSLHAIQCVHVLPEMMMMVVLAGGGELQSSEKYQPKPHVSGVY